MKGERGFTLLELLMVVIIIAILASIALPSYLKAAEKSRSTEALQLLGYVRASENRYKGQNPAGVYSTNTLDLDAVDTTANGVIVTKSWGTFGGGGGGATAGNLTLLANSATLPRQGVPPGSIFGGQVLGIFYLNGNLCGPYAVNSGLDSKAPACS